MNLEKALKKDEEFLALLKDEGFACAAYESFCNQVYIDEQRERFSCSWRYAGGMIAEMRDEGEDYLDYYLGDFIERTGLDRVPLHKDKVQEVYNRLGWRLLTVEDQVQDFKTALELLKERRSLPKAETPDWYAAIKGYMKDWDTKCSGDDPVSVVHRAANDGQVTKEEYHFLHDRFFIESEAADILVKQGVVKNKRLTGLSG